MLTTSSMGNPRRDADSESDAVGERLAVDQLQDEGFDRQPRAWRRLALMHAVNRPDVGMVERRQEAGLAFEAGASVGIGQPEIGQDLERDVAAERRVAGPIDQAHAARAEQSGDLVRSETLARRERGSLVVEDACDRAEHTSAHVAIDRLFEDRSVAGIGGQE